MWRRVRASMLLAFFGLMCVSAPALAGGFAVTTLDGVPRDLRANETYRIGYTIRQHGVTPLVSASTRIVAQSSTTRETAAFVGAPEGAPGHYVAEVRFPSEGTWVWQVEQGPFAPQQLGAISISAAAGARPDFSAAMPVDAPRLQRLLLLATTALAVLVFAWHVTLLLGQTRLERHAS